MRRQAYDYVVSHGETLSSIAQRTGTSVNELARANNISNPNMIYAGSSLRIPGSSAPTPPTRPAGLGSSGGGSSGGGSSSGGASSFYSSQGISRGGGGESPVTSSASGPTNYQRANVPTPPSRPYGLGTGTSETSRSNFYSSQGVSGGGNTSSPVTSAVSGPGRLSTPAPAPAASSGWATKNASAMGAPSAQAGTIRSSGGMGETHDEEPDQQGGGNDPMAWVLDTIVTFAQKNFTDADYDKLLQKISEIRRSKGLAGDAALNRTMSNSRAVASYAERFPHAARTLGIGGR